jgi:hypothetical protein
MNEGNRIYSTPMVRGREKRRKRAPHRWEVKPYFIGSMTQMTLLTFP